MAKKNNSKPSIDLFIDTLIDTAYPLIMYYNKLGLTRNIVKSKVHIFKPQVLRYLIANNGSIDKEYYEVDYVSDNALKKINTNNICTQKMRKSIGLCTFPEHMVPVSYLADFCFDTIYSKITQPQTVIRKELENLLNNMWHTCWITKAEAKQLDTTVVNGKKLRNYMPNPQDPFCRYTTANIHFHKIDLNATWYQNSGNSIII